jgi:hypothetical protein
MPTANWFFFSRALAALIAWAMFLPPKLLLR